MSMILQSRLRLLCVLLMVATTGCNKSPKPNVAGSNPAETGEADAGADASTTSKRIIPIRHGVKDFGGSWVMVVTMQRQTDPVGRDWYIWIVDLKKNAEDKFQAEIVDLAKTEKLDPKIESTTLDGDTLTLQIKNKGSSFEFQGHFDGIAFRGTMGSGTEIYPARLLPTEASKLAPYVGDAWPPAADVFLKAVKAMQSKPKPEPEVILHLAHEHRTSPIALEALYGLLSLQGRFGFDDQMLLSVIAAYVETAKLWGPRMQARAEYLSAEQLVMTARLPAEAIKHLIEADKLSGDQASAVKSRIKMYREQAEIQVSLTKSRTGSSEEKAAAHAELIASLKVQPYNAEILTAVADYEAANKNVDAAIEHYSLIVALPLLEQLVLARRAGQPAGDPTPTEVLTRLWNEKHGSTQDLQAHIANVYTEQMSALKNEFVKAAKTAPVEEMGDHTVLLEFFTGGQMPPAVATEIAIDGMQQTFPTSRLVILRFHQHVPGPDGLVNQDSEDRFAFYEQGKVPLLCVDGAILDPDQVPYGGFMQGAAMGYSIIRAVIDQRLKQNTPIRIELSGKIDQGELAIQAAVSGATEEQLGTCRLRLAIAEESVATPQPNGIRTHSMVVREMPGGARGIAAKKGELKFSYSMPIAELQDHLNDYLSRYENGNKIEIPEDAKPKIKTPLYLVAWVQDDKADPGHPEIGRAVLQTVIIPIAGSGTATGNTENNHAAGNGSNADSDPAPVVPPAPALPTD